LKSKPTFDGNALFAQEPAQAYLQSAVTTVRKALEARSFQLSQGGCSYVRKSVLGGALVQDFELVDLAAPQGLRVRTTLFIGARPQERVKFCISWGVYRSPENAKLQPLDYLISLASVLAHQSAGMFVRQLDPATDISQELNAQLKEAVAPTAATVSGIRAELFCNNLEFLLAH
jgi:hypothetical protein